MITARDLIPAMSGDAVDAVASSELAGGDDLAACHALSATLVSSLQAELEDMQSPHIPVPLAGLLPPALHAAQLPAVPAPPLSGTGASSSSNQLPANVQPAVHEPNPANSSGAASASAQGQTNTS